MLDGRRRPELLKRAEFRSPTDENRDIFFESIRIVGGNADILNVVPQRLKLFDGCHQERSGSCQSSRAVPKSTTSDDH